MSSVGRLMNRGKRVRSNMCKVEYVLAAKVYFQESERRIDPGQWHNGVQVFASTFGHESEKDNAHIER
jgi:hypothetical protein